MIAFIAALARWLHDDIGYGARPGWPQHAEISVDGEHFVCSPDGAAV